MYYWHSAGVDSCRFLLLLRKCLDYMNDNEPNAASAMRNIRAVMLCTAKLILQHRNR